MLNPAEEFETLMQRIRAGEEEAARELFELYGKQIQLVVRRHLSQSLRSQFDSLDFSQDAWASFFHIPPERINFKTPQELLAFLSCLAHHKLIDQQRRQQRTLKRSRHEVNPPETNVKDLPGPHPTPSQFAIAEEQWSRLLQNKSPRVRSALELMRDGHSLREIAEHLGIHPKKLQRLLKCLRRKVLSS